MISRLASWRPLLAHNEATVSHRLQPKPQPYEWGNSTSRQREDPVRHCSLKGEMERRSGVGDVRWLAQGSQIRSVTDGGVNSGQSETVEAQI